MTFGMERLILVIDPQVGFCEPKGSLSSSFGVSELAPITERLRNLEEFLVNYPTRSELCVIKSEYTPGQFTGGDLNDPYSHACVPGYSDDCNLSLSPIALSHVQILTKHEESAAAVPEIIEMLRVKTLKEILLAGFLTTSCVRKTAEVLRNVLPSLVAVGVLEDLTASRASSYKTESGGISRHEAALGEMRRDGILVMRSANIRELTAIRLND